MTSPLVHKDRSKWYGPDNSVPLTIEHPGDHYPGPEDADNWREATEQEYHAYWFYWSEFCAKCGEDRGEGHDDWDHAFAGSGNASQRPPCERCKTPSALDPDSGLCPDCEANNDGRVVL